MKKEKEQQIRNIVNKEIGNVDIKRTFEKIIVFYLFLFVLSIVIILILFINLNSKIKDLPHRYCHNEESTYVLNVKSDTIETFDLNTKITCSDKVSLKVYSAINKQTIYGCLGVDEFNRCKGDGGTCIITKVKEVCEIK